MPLAISKELFSSLMLNRKKAIVFPPDSLPIDAPLGYVSLLVDIRLARKGVSGFKTV